MTRSRSGNGAFTLVETLVAVVLIGVLIALAWSSMNGISQKAKDAKCVSQLRSLGAIALAFSTENQSRLLPFRMEEGRPDSGLWFDHLHSYIGRPEGRAGRVTKDGSLVQYPGWRCPTAQRTYHINRICGWNDGTKALPATYLKHGQGFLKRDGTTFTLPEGLSKTAWFTDPSPLGEAFQFESYRSNGNDFIGFPHSGSCNTLFMDGHVEAVSDPDFPRNSAARRDQRWIAFFGYEL